MPYVLVVDDDPSYLTILERLCAGCGATVITAQTADEARAALAAHEFDLLLLDLQLDHQEGPALIAEVEQNAALASKAVIVTGFSVLAPFFTKLPIVDKGSLTELADYLRPMLCVTRN
jgi:two-component system response regulator PilR (NtrC family)